MTNTKGSVTMSDVIKVGDTVLYGSTEAVVKAVDGDLAWLLFVKNAAGYATRPLSELVKVSPNPTPMHTSHVYIGSSGLYLGWPVWAGAKLAGRLTMWSDDRVTFERAVVESDGTITWEPTT